MVVDWLVAWPVASLAGQRLVDPSPAFSNVVLVDFTTPESSGSDCRRNPSGGHPGKGIKHEAIGIGQCEDEPFDQGHRELARVLSLLDVIALDVRYVPDVFRVLSLRIAGVLAGPRALIVLLPGILLRHQDRVQVENVVVRLGVPEDHFVAAAESVSAMQPVPESPNDAVPHLQAQRFEDRMEEVVERQDRSRSPPAAVKYVIADLPADAAGWL